jgi:hypothetical protein
MIISEVAIERTGRAIRGLRNVRKCNDKELAKYRSIEAHTSATAERSDDEKMQNT